MTKKDLTKRISTKTGLSLHVVCIVTDSIISEIMKSVSEGENVTLRGFGSFATKKISARSFVSVNNNQVDSMEHRKPYFKPSKEFKSNI